MKTYREAIFYFLSMTITPLSEGTFTIDKTKYFIPFDPAKDELQSRSKGSLLVEVQPFLIQTHHDLILLDTGLGFAGSDGVLQIHHNIVEAGFNPMDVTKVLMSHLHKDHAGGVGVEDKMLQRQYLSFPHAVHYIQEKELEFAFQKGEPSYITSELEILKGSDKVELLNGNGTIDNYIRYECTGAHSPFHQVFWISEGDEIVFFGGDDAPQLQQMKSRFVAKYDYDGKKCMELRHQWWAQGRQEHWTFLFYHDVKNPVSKN